MLSVCKHLGLFDSEVNYFFKSLKFKKFITETENKETQETSYSLKCYIENKKIKPFIDVIKIPININIESTNIVDNDVNKILSARQDYINKYKEIYTDYFE